MIRSIIKGLFLIFICFSSLSGQDFEKRLTFLDQEKDLDFFTIDKIFKEYKSDSVFINYLINQNQKTEAMIYGLIVKGVNYRNISKYQESLVLFNQASKASQKLNNLDLYIYSLNMIGVNYRRMDEVRLALDNHKQALALAEKIEKKTEGILRSIAISQNSIGNIYLSLKQYDLAKGQFLKSIVIERSIGNKLGLAINHQNLGFIDEASNNLEEALLNYKSSLKYNEEIDSDLGRIICKNSIGQVLIKMGRASEGLKSILPSLKLSEDLGDKYYMTMAQINLGWAQISLKQYKEAEINLTNGLKMAIENNYKTSASEAYEHLATLYERKGEYEKALQNLKLKQLYGEKVLNEENLRYTQELILKYDSEKKENQIALLEKENEIVNYRLLASQRWLIFGAAFLLLLSILGFIWYRQSQLKSEKKVLMIEQQMMRSQMNPHFLFNSLNSIKLYIINNEKENAIYYLNKFSKLIRAILSNSQEKEISLKEELETMELYVNIESIRFNEKLNYEVIIADNIDTESIKIPSLILQPFIENSIWHGLSNKDGEKHLKLFVNRIGDELRFEIVDNGIGRALAQKIKETKVSKQTSIGLKLTKERLENFAKNLNKSMTMEFEDLMDSQNRPLGTKAIITLPIK
jgi:tetratricopeptide (TPR) repeat protein